MTLSPLLQSITSTALAAYRAGGRLQTCIMAIYRGGGRFQITSACYRGAGRFSTVTGYRGSEHGYLDCISGLMPTY